MNKFYEDCDYYKVITTDEDRKKLADAIESVKDSSDYKKTVEFFSDIEVEIYHVEYDYESHNNYALVIYNSVDIGDKPHEQYLLHETFEYDSQIGVKLEQMLFDLAHIVSCYKLTETFRK